MPHHWPPQASVSQSLWLRAPEQMLPCKRQIHAFLQEGCQLLRRHRIVGTQVPLGCSLAFVQKYTKEDIVSFALYGDGAANQGQLFEALNISALWKMPTILVYRMGTTEWREAKSPLY